jgi:hypothetical protein
MQTTLHRSQFTAPFTGRVGGFVPAAIVATILLAASCGAATTEPAATIEACAAQAGTDWGSSSRHARRRAAEALPLDQMAPGDRQAIESALASTTLYRRLPVELFACDSDLLDFALEKPEAIVDIWRLLGISRLSLDPAGPAQWRLADGYGTVGLLRLAHRERRPEGGMLVFYGRGAYTGPLSPKNLTGNCVLMVRYRQAEPMVDGRHRQAVQIDAFLDMDGIGLEIVTRTLQPLIVHSAAANLHEICLFMASLSDAAAANPEGVATLARRLPRTAAADQQTLATIALTSARRQRQPQPAVQLADNEGRDAADRLTVDLAARWLQSEELDRLKRR